MIDAKWISSTALVLGAVLFVSVNALLESTLVGVRLDLTQHRLYTLSSGTRNILKRLQEPVTVRLYVSKQIATRLPLYGPYAIRVEELLHEYSRLAGNKINLEVIDPEPFSEAEDRAVANGLQGIPLTDGETKFYFGIAASGPTDERAVIPFLTTDREEFLEYDLTKLVHQVAWPKKPVIGLIDTLNLTADQNSMAMRTGNETPIAIEQMRKAFDVHTLDKTLDRIPEDIDVLLLIQPLGLDASTYYAIDQFVLRGGRILAFVDPLPEDSSSAVIAPPDSFSKLTAAWGVTIDTSKVVGDLQLARQVQYQNNGRISAARYLPWLNLPQDFIDNSDVITAKLGSLNLASAGAISKNADAKTQFIPLVYTTEYATTMDASMVKTARDLQAMLRNFRPDNKSYTLAARVTGSIATAFPDGPPPKAVPSDNTNQQSPAVPPLPEQLKVSKKATNIVIVADTDMLQDRFWVQVQNLMGIRLANPNAANGSFLVNALDNLSGDNDLISVRNRGLFSRPFTRINQLRQAAEQKYLATEQHLVEQLAATEQRLSALERGKRGTSSENGKEIVLNAAQQQELLNFRQEKLRIRKELRDVRYQLGKDIENLENWIKFIHLGLIPILIAIAGIWFGLLRNSRQYQNQFISTSSLEKVANA